MSDDDRDYTDRFNTQLSPKQEMEFQKLQNKGDLYDYDLRGAFKANGFKPFDAGHLTDKFKKPNHPTFSTESQYNGVDGAKGGTWTKRPDGSYSFKPGQGNVYTAQELRDYFAKQEKGNEVVLPPDIKGIDTSKFRRSDNIEDRRNEPPVDPGPPNSGDFPAQPWQGERIAKTQGRNRLADALGRDDIPEAARRVPQEVAGRPASFDDRFDGGGELETGITTSTASAAPLMSMPAGDRQQAIVRAARENGIDPSAALAIAERESNFDPKAASSKTIRGMYQMRGDLRHQYGIGDSSDPYEQASGWGKFFNANKGEMSRVLGRNPSDAEGYLGHHFGSTRAARMLKMDPATPVDQVFTENEMSLNPHFAKAGTVGALNSSVMADINKRQAKFGGGAGAELPDLAEFGEPVDASNPGGKSDIGQKPVDLSSFGTVASQGPDLPQPSAAAASSAPDLSSFGTPA